MGSCFLILCLGGFLKTIRPKNKNCGAIWRKEKKQNQNFGPGTQVLTGDPAPFGLIEWGGDDSQTAVRIFFFFFMRVPGGTREEGKDKNTKKTCKKRGAFRGPTNGLLDILKKTSWGNGCRWTGGLRGGEAMSSEAITGGGPAKNKKKKKKKIGSKFASVPIFFGRGFRGGEGRGAPVTCFRKNTGFFSAALKGHRLWGRKKQKSVFWPSKKGRRASKKTPEPRIRTEKNLGAKQKLENEKTHPPILPGGRKIWDTGKPPGNKHPSPGPRQTRNFSASPRDFFPCLGGGRNGVAWGGGGKK